MGSNPSDILLLAQMLKPEDENSTDSEDDLPAPGKQKLGIIIDIY